MTGAAWIMLWLGYLAVSLGGGAVCSFLGAEAVRRWMIVWGALGALGLLLMVPALHAGGISTIVLPRPFPLLAAAPLPLSGAWAAVAALLFGSTVLVTARRSDAHQIWYALSPLLAGVGIFLWSGDALLLIVSWEFISAVTYLGLVTTRRARPVWNAGWILLALSELGGMLLIVALIWLIPIHTAALHDSLGQLASSARHASPLLANVVMLMAVLAFGVKAGLFPVMIWMPMAEPQAPGMVAGLFSGLLTALAVSGILALAPVTGPHWAWAVVLVVLGVLGAMSGALYSVVSRHVKRVLAYSTLEIMGLVFAAVGVWRIVSILDPANVASNLAMDAIITILAMHAGAKFALFAITDYTGEFSHTLDGLGGLARQSKPTAFLALLAILSLAAFPPLGGFVGEWLLLESLLKPLVQPLAGVHLALIAAGAACALAMALGLAAYLRWFGFIFLGTYRGHKAVDQRPGPLWLVGVGLPLTLIVIAGPGVPWFLPWINHRMVTFLSSRAPVVAPTFVNPHTAPPLIPIAVNLVPAPGAHGTVFFPQAFNVGDPYVLFLMAIALTVAAAGIRGLARASRPVRQVAPWNGGAETYSARTSWSAEGFAHPLRLAFARFYGLQRSRVTREGAHFYRHTIINRVEEQIYAPMVALGNWLGDKLRKSHSGRLGHYTAYVWVAALVAVIVGALR